MSKVSVILSTYCRNRPGLDCPNLLRRAIESVMTQTFKDFELILIDDGSKDGSEQVCKEYAAKDARIKLYRYEVNSGLPAKRYNDGMSVATTDFFMFMFDDDWWVSSAIETLYGAIAWTGKGYGMVYGLADLVDVETKKRYANFGA